MSLSRTKACLGLAATTLAAALVLRPAGAQTVPADALPTCIFSPAAFAAMFESGTVTLNGAVRPADSTVNPGASGLPCPFFLWGDQMYLWLTSPATEYAPAGGGGTPPLTLFSPAFYTVGPEDSNGRRNFVRNVPNAPVRMRLRTLKPPLMLPLLRARTGQLVEVAPAPAGAAAAPTIRLRSGNTARLGSVRRTIGDTIRFFDTRGRPLQVRRAVLPRLRRPTVQLAGGERLGVIDAAAAHQAIPVRRFTFHGVSVYLDRNNDVVDVEEGQAGTGGVLIAQNLVQPSQAGSLVYYLIAVNDVYAYHRTMQGPAPITDPTTVIFPQSVADVEAVMAYANSVGLPPIPDPQALAIETKSSWVEASTVPNPEDYVQIRAVVPTFDRSNPNRWVQNGEQSVALVMVGLHVVGSTAGHGEMVWASFEHFGNAPNVAYSYNNASGTVTVGQDTTGTWLFTPNGSQGPFNPQNATWNPATANPPNPPYISGSPVAPSPVLRLAPWGSMLGAVSAAMNTEIIAVNNSRIGQLAPGDVRRNYFQLGAVWTDGGVPPAPQSDPANLVGTTQLANGTMETFVQGPTATVGTSCFSCHQSATALPASVAVSHVYGVLNPLPPPFRSRARRPAPGAGAPIRRR